MAYDSTATKLATKVSTARNSARTSQNQFSYEISSLASWWQGAAQKKFQTLYGQIDADANKMFGNLDRLETNLKGLASAIRVADEERRREAARRAAAAAKKA